MTPRKKQHNKWHIELKSKLALITWCEDCGATDGSCGILDIAHRKKRYDIGWKTEDDHQEYLMAAKIGRKHHTAVDENWNKDNDPDFDAHQIMYDYITRLVEARPEW